ncbi:hypothetical protein EDD15DRAFT_1727618 [Pisolithus albus]|nr:hypothetical protein EDD15DRAFT_1727618 [Pisolithus albus]
MCVGQGRASSTERDSDRRGNYFVESPARVSAKLGETIPSKRIAYYHFFVWKGTLTQPLSCLLGDNNWSIIQRLSSCVTDFIRNPSVSYCTVLASFSPSSCFLAFSLGPSFLHPTLSSGTSVGKHRGQSAQGLSIFSWDHTYMPSDYDDPGTFYGHLHSTRVRFVTQTSVIYPHVEQHQV